MNTTCAVVLDLMPLVRDGVASDDSAIAVEEHIKKCPRCKAEFDSYKIHESEQPTIKDEKIIFAIKRSILLTQITLLVTGAIVGVTLTNSMGMFYNLIIMPMIGAISFITFREKSYLVVLAVFMLSFLWQVATGILLAGFNWIVLSWGSFYGSTIYAALVGLGIIIAMLLKFAFKKER